MNTTSTPKSNATGLANTQQPINLKSKKNNSNETLNFNQNTANSNSINASSTKNKKNSSSFKDLNSETTFTNDSHTVLIHDNDYKIKSSTLPLESNNTNKNNSVSYSLNSNNTTTSSYGSIVNTTQTNTDSFYTEKESKETLVQSKKLFKSTSDNFSSHSANQSEHNMSAAATATTVNALTNSSKQTSSTTLPHPTSTSSSSSLSSSSAANQAISNSSVAVNKTSSTSYLDESNLKLAIIDYPDILKLIKLQNSIEYQEWLAFNTKMYFDQINVLYGAIVDHCTLQSCPTMNAPLNNQFYWTDDKGKKFKYSASQYIDTVLTYIAKIVSDENYFPTKCGHPFPANFDSLVKKIHKHLFHILAHMYHSHYKELLLLKLNTYVNSIYLHFYSFNKSFNLLEDKEIEIMDALNKSFLNKYSTTSTQQLASSLMQNQQHPPTIHQSASSSSSTGFSFFKKKLNFNLMA